MGSQELFHRVVQTMTRWSSNGEKLLSHGVRLICPTPQVAPEAWLHVLFPPLALSEIEKMVRKLGMPLPEDFKQFLMRANGVELFSYRISVWGVRKSLARTGDEAWQPFDILDHNVDAMRPVGSPDNVLYFAGADGGDSWCFFELGAGRYRVGKTERHNFRPITYWPDFEAWLIDEIGSLEMLFDLEGLMISKPPPERIM